MKTWSGICHLLHHPMLKWVNACIGSFVQISMVFFLLSSCCSFSLQSLKKEYIFEDGLSYKVSFCLCPCQGTFFHLWCAPWLWINQCSVGQFLAYRVCLCSSSVIIQIALSSQAYMNDVCPFCLQNARLALCRDLCCWNYAVHGTPVGNLS